MKVISMLFFAAVLSFSFSNATAQKKITLTLANGDTVIVEGPTVHTTVPPAVKETPVKKKAQPVKKQPVTPVRNQPTSFYNPAPWYYPIPAEQKKDQFSTPMIILFSVFGLFGLAGLILGVIAVSRRTPPSRPHYVTVHGGTSYGATANANPDLSQDYHGDHSSREENFTSTPEKKEEKVSGNGMSKESAN